MTGSVKRELISKKTRIEFREHMVGWTLREISYEFDAFDILCDLDHDPQLDGQRRTLVEQYYHTLDFTNWQDVQKLLKVYESILSNLDVKPEPWVTPTIYDENRQKRFAILLNHLKRDGFVYEEGCIVSKTTPIPLTHVQQMAFVLDSDHIHQHVKRMQDAIESDPDQAIGSAKEFVESIAKTILIERNALPNSTKLDVRDLVKTCLKELSLVPQGISNESKGAEDIKLLLNNLSTVVDRLDALRNHYGTGHGRASTHRGLTTRHAKLAVGAATTLGVFLFETHLEKPVTATNAPSLKLVEASAT